MNQALQELAKGERTASALENQLTRMEARIEALLEQAEREQREVQQGGGSDRSDATSNGTGSRNGTESKSG